MISLMGCGNTKKIQELADSSANFEQKRYSKNDIRHLPEPVQRYFNYALTDGQSHVDNLYLKQEGVFKTKLENDFVPITAEQYFTAANPGFVWLGKTKTFKARDSYINGQGALSVYLFGFLRVVKYTGKAANQAELLRWLGESVWMPTSMLPNENITWEPIDKNHAKLVMNYRDMEIYYDIEFNDKGQIVSMLTERYTDDDNKAPWLGKVSNYQEENGMMVPKTIEASWIIDGETKPYGRFDITEMEFDASDRW
jgi:hypothetical protein